MIWKMNKWKRLRGAALFLTRQGLLNIDVTVVWIPLYFNQSFNSLVAFPPWWSLHVAAAVIHWFFEHLIGIRSRNLLFIHLHWCWPLGPVLLYLKDAPHLKQSNLSFKNSYLSSTVWSLYNSEQPITPHSFLHLLEDLQSCSGLNCFFDWALEISFLSFTSNAI